MAYSFNSILYLFVLVAAVAAVNSPRTFSATSTTVSPFFSGNEVANLRYNWDDATANQKLREEIVIGNNVMQTKIFSSDRGTPVIFSYCGQCSANLPSTDFPRYYVEDADDQNGDSIQINGMTCYPYQKRNPNPLGSSDVKTMWLDGSNSPCRADYVDGHQVTFSNVNTGGIDQSLFSIPQNWNCPVEQCVAPVDMFLIMDRSGSITNSQWVLFKSFVVQFVKTLNINPQNINVGVILFADNAVMPISLTNNQQNANNAVNALLRGGSGDTCVGCGLILASQQFLAHNRPDAKKMYLVLTDGESNVEPKGGFQAAINQARGLGTVFGIGVGADQNANILNVFASQNQPVQTVYLSAAWSNLYADVFQKLLAATCSLAKYLNTVQANPCGSGCRGSCLCGQCHCPSNCEDLNWCTWDPCDENANGHGCYHTAVDCSDNDQCTNVGCDIPTGCWKTPVNCDDGNKCTTDTCNSDSGCVHTPVTCDDQNACTADSCNGADGTCINTQISCDDKNACTNDTCIPSSGCKSLPFPSSFCDDGRACTQDSCNPAGPANNPCVHSQVQQACACETKVCPSTKCIPQTCQVKDGSCLATPVNCDDKNICTTDTCTEADGSCANTFSACADMTNLCLNVKQICNATVGCIVTPVVCDDKKNFTTDTCNPAIGCVFTPIPVCDDHNNCTADLSTIQLDAATGISYMVCNNSAIVCNDHDACTIDGCDILLGCTTTNITCPGNSSATCLNFLCNSFTGCYNESLECPPIDACHQGICEIGLGCIQKEYTLDTGAVCQAKCDADPVACGFAALSAAQKGAIIGSAGIAGIAVGGAAAAGLLGYGGKKGYDFIKASSGGGPSVLNNPLYQDNGAGGTNPLYGA